jgi:hypothetical protein
VNFAGLFVSKIDRGRCEATDCADDAAKLLQVNCAIGEISCFKQQSF